MNNAQCDRAVQTDGKVRMSIWQKKIKINKREKRKAFEGSLIVMHSWAAAGGGDGGGGVWFDSM